MSSRITRTALRGLVVAAAVLSTACGAAPTPTAAVAQPAQAAAAAAPKSADAPHIIRGDTVTGDARIGTYVSTGKGFRTRTYWIEGPTGVVLIDTQFMPSAGLEALAAAEAATGKKVVLAVVLHPNPDKFNGTKVLQDRGIRVVTSAQVAAHIPAVHALRTRWFEARYRPDYPTVLPAPEVFGDATTTLEAGGIALTLRVLGGPGCSAAHLAAEFEGHLFVGDLVANGFHAWMELGLLDAWRARLAELAALKPRAVHPGRGASGDVGLLHEQTAYLDEVTARVTAARGVEPFDREAAVAQVIAELEASHPDFGFPYFLKLGVPAVFGQQLGEVPAGH